MKQPEQNKREKSYRNRIKKIFLQVLRYRYLIALVVFALLVVFKINGSNINCWKYLIDEPDTTLVGSSRSIRSDEWEVLIPVFLSQQNSDTPFSVINHNITPSGQNVVITLDAPVKDIYSITKPLHWGFFFLDADHALAWYWDLKLILIFLLSFELCMILTRQNKLVSALGSLWITLSPAVQWWFAQHVGDNVLYVPAMIVTFYYLCKNFDYLRRKILFTALFCLSCLGFVTPLYPPVQIPFGFLALILMALIYFDFRKEIRFKRIDLLIFGIAAIFIFAMLAHLYLIIKDAIPLMNNTVYPGQRASTGGDTPPYSFYIYLTNFALPWQEIYYHGQFNQNNCELSSFYNFLPAVLLAFPVLLKRRGDRKYGIALACFSVFFALYMSFSFIPAGVAKITLLSYVTGQRAMLAYGFAAMLLSIWALAELSRSGGLGRFYSLAVTGAVFITYFITIRFSELNKIIRYDYLLLFSLLLALLNYLLLRGFKKTFSALMACVILASGFLVNPITVGTGGFDDSTLAKEIHQLDKADSSAVWLADSGEEITGALGIFLYANGARSVGGINNYPDFKKWAAIDPNQNFEDIYNRSAHISFRIVKSPTVFTLVQPGAYVVSINVNDLSKLNIRYVVSNQPITSMNSGNIQFKALFKPDKKGYTIYQVDYQK